MCVLVRVCGCAHMWVEEKKGQRGERPRKEQLVRMEVNWLRLTVRAVLAP